MARYIDGFVFPVPKKNMAKYKKMAMLGKKTWMKFGALEYYECVGDNVKVPYGLPFTKAYKVKPTETIVFAFIIYKSKSHRDAVTKKVMKAFNEMGGEMEMLYDMKRFSVGGFKTILHT